MKSNYKYATISDGERLHLIRQGNKEMYDEEIARANEAIKNRDELGLDTSDQLDWIKKVKYVRTNNNGIGSAITPEERKYLESTGKSFQVVYSSDYAAGKKDSFNQKKSPDGLTGDKSGGGKSPEQSFYDEFMSSKQRRRDDMRKELEAELANKSAQADNYYNSLNSELSEDAKGQKNDYYVNALSRQPAMYEKFANSGISFDGGRARSEELAANSAMNRTLAAIDGQVLKAMNENNVARGGEKSKAYTDFVNKLADENARLDELDYQMQKDMQASKEKSDALAFDKYKYETDMMLANEDKTAEQQRWEKEFGLKLDSQTFDKMLKRDELAMESDKFIFDQDKYRKEYDLKLDQYNTDKLYKDRDYDLKTKQYQLDFDNAEFNRALDNLKYNFDVDKFDREYDLKESQAKTQSEQYNKDMAFKQDQAQADMEKYLRDYALKQSAQNTDNQKVYYDYKNTQDKLAQDKSNDAAALTLKQQQEAADYQKWLREIALKEYIEKSNLTKAEKEYALSYYEATKDTGNTSANKSSTGTTNTTTSGATTNNLLTGGATNSLPAGSAGLYDNSLTTGMWMKTQYTNNGKNSIRKFTDNDIDTWVNSLKLTAAEKTRLKKSLGIE